MFFSEPYMNFQTLCIIRAHFLSNSLNLIHWRLKTKEPFWLFCLPMQCTKNSLTLSPKVSMLQHLRQHLEDPNASEPWLAIHCTIDASLMHHDPRLVQDYPSQPWWISSKLSELGSKLHPRTCCWTFCPAPSCLLVAKWKSYWVQRHLWRWNAGSCRPWQLVRRLVQSVTLILIAAYIYIIIYWKSYNVLHLKYRQVLTFWNLHESRLFAELWRLRTSITIHPFSKFFPWSKVREIDLLWANFGQLLLQRLKTFLKGFRWLDKECTWGNGLGTWRSLFWQHGNSLKSVCAFFSLRNLITGLWNKRVYIRILTAI